LVLNDVGPTIEPAALARIGSYVGQVPRFETVEAAADYFLSISEGFGPHTREQWLALTRPMLRRIEDEQGVGYIPHYDPKIAVPFHAATPEMAAAAQAMLWQRYDSLRTRTLVLRGAQSDLLTRQTAQAMAERGPRAKVVEFEGVGHAPTLVDPAQVAVVREFLTSA
jgi:pimeloyl-ACP methyl ester carboxylesterase